ncbi:uncharacterized protein LOC143510962 isoform X2 [Brachyhypopomus gauderio]|uniref:uncharacterized protein LOC143510962 isoform X2 n=1 Tax=Brachyhypopomus gauderio TaxID=698409 RepID=UPI0040416847
MKIRLIISFLISTVGVFCNGFRVLGSSGPLTAQPGDSVMLPCYVQTPIPVEELEVEWRRTDSETVVHLFQDGDSRPESQDQTYRDRAHFFTEEVAHGNFSLLLTDVSTKDTGVYKCVVYRNQVSNETLIELKMSEYLTVSGGHVVSAYVGEDTTLNCSVHSHTPPEELQQVSWKKIDTNFIVLLFVKGHIKPESTHERYTDRVELFNLEEIHRGNFSLRLKNVRTEDKGLYVCEALTGVLSANTTVEVLQLGLSSMHIAILFLCVCVCVCGMSLLLMCVPWPCVEEEDNRVMKLQYILVFCPNIVIFIAFILWGQTEGFYGEVAVCSAINLVRILRLLYYSPFTSMGIKLSTMLEFLVMTAVIFSGFLFRISRGFLFGLSFILIFFIVNWRGDEKDKMGLIFDSVLLFILTVLVYVEEWFSVSVKEPKALVFKMCMCGTAVLFVVNSVILSTELILSARNGKRTVEDLQLVLLPFEWVSAVGFTIAIFVVELSKQKDNGKENEEYDEHHEGENEEELNSLQSTPPSPSTSISPTPSHMTDE